MMAFVLHSCIIMHVLVAMLYSQSIPQDFDCPMRELALEFAQHIQPWLSQSQLQQIADGLNGSPESRNCSVKPSSSLLQQAPEYPIHQAPNWIDFLVDIDPNVATIYVDYNHGHDHNDGSIARPIKHLNTALIKLRSLSQNTDTLSQRIILRKGTHYIADTIHINANDSNLLITNYNHEHVVVSGTKPLNCNWTKYKQAPNGLYYYQCDLSQNNITDIKGLRVNGIRAIRARYPNGNPERYPCGFCSDLKALRWLPPTLPSRPEVVINPDYPVRTGTNEPAWQHYYLGIGGECENFVPNAGFWCNGEYKVPSGLVFTKEILPNAPYANASGAIIQTWRPDHWSSWMFEIGQYNATNMTFIFSRGGFQGARGNANGSEFFIENVYEELDYPTEYFYNTTTKTLYYYNNETSGIDSLEFEATNKKVLFNLTGDSMDHPVKNVEIRGLTLRDTAYTYLDPHGMPSGGDWALDRTGAIYLDHTENIMIQNNLMTRLDGNGISINRYNRNVTIYRNEMTLLGGSAITLWGDTRNISYPVLNDPVTSMGYDGTDGNQPRMINVMNNYVHELGIYEKQSSFFFQAKSCSNYIYGNIFYNGPRAGINYNDGFGGNSTILNNLLFNTCRESGDHGPFNSWDRQVYVTKVRNGTASTIKAFDHIVSNFMIANYQSRWAVDNDDGSSFYNVSGNFLVYAESGLKSYFGAHDIIHTNNIHAYISGADYDNNACVYDNGDQLIGHWDRYYNNTCIINREKPSQYAWFHCDDAVDVWPILGNNTVFIQGNDTSSTGACGLNEKEFQIKYNVDQGTVILPGPPNNADILRLAKSLLWI
eukprot:54547_1